MKKKSALITGILLAAAVAICVIPLVLVTGSEFGGADDQAGNLIAEIDADYEPWFESIWEPPGSETASLLFSLQAAIGSGVLFGGLGYLSGYRRRKKEDEAED